MDNITQVEVSYQPIELCKLLKIANMVGGGGEAKIVISEGYVLLNNEVEFQKRKKVYHQDIIEFNGEVIEVICFAPVTQVDKTKTKTKKTTVQVKPKTPKKEKSSSAPENSPLPGRRKRISF